MKIELKEIAIRDVVNGYLDDETDGSVVGFNGRLNIRPKYQREFVYKDEQRDAVIYTVLKNFPLNVMYWVKNGEESYEVLDGQQRTISLCEFVEGEFSIKLDKNTIFFETLTKEEQNQILDYKLMVYFCEGTDKEKLEWFKTINIAGEQLTDQELRNAVYTGPWLSDAKTIFSKNSCAAYGLGNKFLKGTPIRQDYLETALKWISHQEGKTIVDYMAEHQRDSDANELWTYFQEVISWIKITFPHYRNEMKGLDWGILYNKYSNNHYNSSLLEERIKLLMQDDDVNNKKGIYEYLLSGNEKHLNIRRFSSNMKREAYERQLGICAICHEHFEIDEMEGDHITPWSLGGKTNSENCQMLCIGCNRSKSNK